MTASAFGFIIMVCI